MPIQEQEIEKTVYFVRHGESEDNVAPVFQSRDTPLSEKGRAQADSVAERVSHISFETLISSTLPRARETADAIEKKTGAHPEYSDLFVERIKPTSINGKPHSDKKASITWNDWRKSLFTPGLRAEDGENFDDLIARVDRALAYLTKRPERSLVVVTHGFFLQALAARVILRDLFSGETFRRIRETTSMENTGITVLRYHGGFEEEPSWHLWIFNDHAHLAE